MMVLIRAAVAILVPSLLLLTSGCVWSDAYELAGRGNRVRSDRAIIVFGASDDRYAPLQTDLAIQFDHYSLADRKITGNCFHYDRLEITRPTATGTTEYFAFIAPPGHYVITPFMGRPVDENALLAFFAPAGEVTYFGNFSEAGGEDSFAAGKITWSSDLPAAAVFTESRRLPEPNPARTTPINDPGPLFVCTP